MQTAPPRNGNRPRRIRLGENELRGLLERAQKALTDVDYRRLKALVDVLESLRELMGVDAVGMKKMGRERATKGSVK
jgi:hypothetical protein